MIALNEAKNKVHDYINLMDVKLADSDRLVILEEETIEKNWGWVFFYTSVKWYETGDDRYMLAGNAPLIVEKKTGKVLATGTALSIDEYIANYERCGDPHG